jgi:hypothetical protein
MLVPALLIAIPVHEMGHAAAAYLLGDRSVRYFGYFTLNPRRFLDPLGVIAVLVALVGWGRKVPVQPNRISTMSQRLLHTLGGPAANLLAAIAFGLVYRALSSAGIYPALTLSGLIETLFRSRNARFFFNASVRRREIWVGAVIVIFVGSLLGVPVLSIVMSPLYTPASLISVGRCIGYGVPGFNALNPCLL